MVWTFGYDYLYNLIVGTLRFLLWFSEDHLRNVTILGELFVGKKLFAFIDIFHISGRFILPFAKIDGYFQAAIHNAYMVRYVSMSFLEIGILFSIEKIKVSKCRPV